MEYIDQKYFDLESTIIDNTTYIILEEFYNSKGDPKEKITKIIIGSQASNEYYNEILFKRLKEFGFSKDKQIYNLYDTIYELKDYSPRKKFEIYRTSLGYIYNSRKKLFYSIEIL